MNIKQLQVRYSSIKEASGTISNLLRQVESRDASELYARIQRQEAAVANAHERLDATTAAQFAARERYVAAKDRFSKVISAGVSLCKGLGLQGNQVFDDFDSGDDVAKAQRLEGIFARAAPSQRKAFSALLEESRRLFDGSNRALTEAQGRFDAATRHLEASIYVLQGLLAQGRAVLAWAGMALPKRRYVRRKRNEDGSPPPPAAPVAASPT